MPVLDTIQTQPVPISCHPCLDLPCLTQKVFGEKPNLPEYKVAAIRKSPFILLHCGALRATWDGFILLATLYVAVTVPYSVCVSTAREPSAARGPPSVCDLAVEVLFILGRCPLCLPPSPMPGAPRALMGTVCMAPVPHRCPSCPFPVCDLRVFKSDLGSICVSTTNGLCDPEPVLASPSLFLSPLNRHSNVHLLELLRSRAQDSVRY